MRSVGVQYLVHNPEQFIESNTEHSWQDYWQRMSCQKTWADAIIIQAVASCFNLSIHIAESNPTFSPVTIVEPMNVTDGLNIYIGHLDELHYVSTVQNSSLELPVTDKSKCTQNADESKSVDNNETHKAYKKDYVRQYMMERRADENFLKKREGEIGTKKPHQ